MNKPYRKGMTKKAAPAFLTILVLIPFVSFAQQAKSQLSTPEQLKDEFSSVPCKKENRLSAAKALFERMGATSSSISVESFKDVDNLVIRKEGASQERIVIGAHYDFVSDGCGAVDNWTGVVTLAHLYRTVKDVSLNKTLLFVAFDKEEQGLVGSKAMVKAIEKERLAQYCGMINIDSLGLGVPHAPGNMSGKKLGQLASKIAKEMNLPFNRAGLMSADSDSSPFLDKGIPALTISGLSNNWSSILHGPKDQKSMVNPSSVYLGYRLTLVLLVRMDQADCAAFR